jgi:hypothetical protein
MTAKNLPQYARSAPRAKLVKIVCMQCKVPRYAEASKTPWKLAPHARDPGLWATCLFCGKRDYSPRHWTG